jgi:NDP-sugar pyrophosphorylase family protein
VLLAGVYEINPIIFAKFLNNTNMSKPTLVILAAGMASRYGSMKQIAGFGPHNETIMDYSIYDAIRAGFSKVVFIIREDFADNFKAIVEPKLKGKIEIEYVFQSLSSYLPEGFEIPEGRAKPWGTAHAVLCAKNAVHENFIVINADDFYGSDGFKKAYDFCINGCNDKTYGIIGYTLSNTLSEHGTVSRGVCQTDGNGNLTQINERVKIYWKGEKVVYEDETGEHEVPANSPVSMNFWAFPPSMFELTQKMFNEFVVANAHNIKAEFFIPLLGDDFIKEGHGTIKVIPTDASWFGVTYPEDAPGVKASIEALVNKGEYPSPLF